WVWHLENIWMITGGTATSRRLKGRSYPSFNILTFKEGTISLTEVNVTDGSTRKVLEMPLGQ
ncbi:MAG: metallophosphoesterase, partial [candidate division WOR-3 bacterium]